MEAEITQGYAHQNLRPDFEHSPRANKKKSKQHGTRDLLVV